MGFLSAAVVLAIVNASKYLTPAITGPLVVVGVVTLVAAFWLRWAALNGGLRVWHLFVNGALYVTYLTAVLA